MCKELLGERYVKRHEERRPIYAVEFDDIFANDLAVWWPYRILFIAGSEWITGIGQIIDQGIQPDIDGLRIVVWNRNAPL